MALDEAVARERMHRLSERAGAYATSERGRRKDEEERLARESKKKEKARRYASIGQGLGQLAGMGIGAVAGGPVGAGIGGAAGSALGGIGGAALGGDFSEGLATATPGMVRSGQGAIGAWQADQLRKEALIDRATGGASLPSMSDLPTAHGTDVPLPPAPPPVSGAIDIAAMKEDLARDPETDLPLPPPAAAPLQQPALDAWEKEKKRREFQAMVDASY